VSRARIGTRLSSRRPFAAGSRELLAYGTRAQTRSDHLQLVLGHEGWHRPGGEEHASLAAWLGERAVEHDAPATLMDLASEHLRARRLLRPPVETLLRMIGAARGETHRHVERIFAEQLTAARRAELDGLLDAETGRSSELAELRRRATRTGTRELRVQVTRYLRLLELAAAKIDVSALPPARRRTLEAMGRRMSAQQLRRLEPARRQPLLLVLLRALVIERGDELLDGFDKLLRLTDARARRRVDAQRRKSASQRDELAVLGQRLSVILLECAATGELPMERVGEEIGVERLRAAAAIDPAALPSIEEQQFDQLRTSYSHLRPAIHAVLEAVALQGATAADDGDCPSRCSNRG
jgi:hypothetical protein